MGCCQSRFGKEPGQEQPASAGGLHSQVKVSDETGTSFHYTQQGFVGFSDVTTDSTGETKVEHIIITPSKRNKNDEKFVYFLSTPSM
jgi:hypothetical protein